MKHLAWGMAPGEFQSSLPMIVASAICLSCFLTSGVLSVSHWEDQNVHSCQGPGLHELTASCRSSSLICTSFSALVTSVSYAGIVSPLSSQEGWLYRSRFAGEKTKAPERLSSLSRSLQ